MDWEGKIGSPQLTCTHSGRTLQANEIFYSALVIAEGTFKRLDFAEDIWDNVDHTSFMSWWRQRVPDHSKERKPFKLNAATLAQIFHNLKDTRSRLQQCLAYVVALALVRARKLQFLRIEPHGDGQSFLVQERGTSTVHRLNDPHMSSDEEAHVLDQLILLTTDADAVETAQ